MFTDYKPYSLSTGGKVLSLDAPVVMGILNTTPDSFFDGGKYHTIELALRRCGEMLEQGAAIIDAGGQSSRPGADIISEEEELKRTIPVIEAISREFPGCIISIDTFRSSVARAAIEAGAGMVNDISSGDDDPEMIQTVAKLGVPYIAMHKKGSIGNMQIAPSYDDVCHEVKKYLEDKVEACRMAGIAAPVVDPGFGFGKTLQHNYRLLKNISMLHSLNCPVLVGISRKSMIWKLLESDAGKALNGTGTAHTMALLQGAHILRVHDVKEAMECIRIVHFCRNA